MTNKINGRRKGAGYERQIAKDLTKWTGQPFDRVFRSGGGVAKGDVAPAYGSWPFVLEIKNRESWDFSNFYDNKGPIFSWWDKAAEEAKVAKKLPMLVLKKNRKPALVCLTLSGIKQIGLSSKHKSVTTHHKKFVVILLSDMLNAEAKSLVNP